MTVADAGNDRPQPFSGTGFSGALTTNGQLKLTYKGGGKGPAAPPPSKEQPGASEEILGMTVVTEPANRPGGVPGLLVKRVKPKKYTLGPGAASGDFIIAANNQSVTCVEDLQRAVGATPNQPVSLTIVRSGKTMTIWAEP